MAPRSGASGATSWHQFGTRGISQLEVADPLGINVERRFCATAGCEPSPTLQRGKAKGCAWQSSVTFNAPRALVNSLNFSNDVRMSPTLAQALPPQ
jgi:hypothetical protein